MASFLAGLALTPHILPRGPFTPIRRGAANNVYEFEIGRVGDRQLYTWSMPDIDSNTADQWVHAHLAYLLIIAIHQRYPEYVGKVRYSSETLYVEYTDTIGLHIVDTSSYKYDAYTFRLGTNPRQYNWYSFPERPFTAFVRTDGPYSSYSDPTPGVSGSYGAGGGFRKAYGPDELEPGYTNFPEALVHVVVPDYSVKYEVTLNGTPCSFTTVNAVDATSKVNIQTTNIAEQLRLAINASTGTHGVTAWRYGSTLHLTSGSDFTLKVADDLAGQALKGIKWVAESFSDLPALAPADYRLKISGDPESSQDAYHVIFNDAKGLWEETVAPGIENSIDANTMPHVLSRKTDQAYIDATLNPLGIYFEFDVGEWDSRSVGDLNTSPFPSFVSSKDTDGGIKEAQYITAMTFYKNRLAFACKQNLVFSESGSFWNFFPKTVITTLDSDPIDVTLNTTEIADIQYMKPQQDELILFSDRVQLICRGGDVFSAATVEVVPVSHYEMSRLVQPVSVGASFFFSNNKKNFSDVIEYRKIDQGTSWEGKEVTEHVPNYIPAGVLKMVGNSTQNAVFAIASQGWLVDIDEIYVYDYRYQGSEQVQSAWHKWRINGHIRDMFLEDSRLFLIVAYNEADEGRNYVTYIEEINLDFDEVEEELGHPVLLDRREEITNTDTPVLEDWDNREVHLFSGRKFIGFPYEQRYDFSKLYLRRDGDTLVDGRLQARRMTLSYADTSNFVVTVSVNGSSNTRAHEFNGRTIGSAENLLGVIPVASGEYTVPLMSRSDRLNLSITNSTPLNAKFQSAIWEGYYHYRAKRMR